MLTQLIFLYFSPPLPLSFSRSALKRTVIELTTCNVRGKDGPTSDDCDVAYNNTEAASAIQVMNDHMYKGVQVWKVPSENYYT